jgi:hypothetical protein
MTPHELTANLPTTLEYIGEFGTELICFVPFVHWLHVHGHLAHRRVVTYAGMRPFYYFVDGASYAEKAEARRYRPRDKRPTYLPNRGELMARKSPFEIFPDYRTVFGGRFGHAFKKPLLVIQNKHCREWAFGPINFIALESLGRLFGSLKDRFQIVYSRDGFGGIATGELGFSADHNDPVAFEDEDLLRRYPEVISFERLVFANAGRLSYNELKLRVFSDCRCFIASQGGGNYLAGILGGGTMVILHRAGYELRDTYAHGFYRYAGMPSPRLLIARNSAELEDAARIFHSDVGSAKDNTARDPDIAQLLEKYSPERTRDPNHVPARPAVW